MTSALLPDVPHSLPVADALAILKVSAVDGLSEAEAKRRAEAYGPNAILSRRKTSAIMVLLHQFQSPVVYLLATAAALALYFGELEEGIAIAAVLAINAAIGFLTELKAARSIEALRALGTHSARVRRGGHTRLLAAEDIVPGDIILVEAGDSIVADLRLVEASNITADESTLTGESIGVEKDTKAVAADARLAERSSMLFKGTPLTRGSGVGVVVATGLQTEIGRISQLVEQAESGSSPLELKLARLSGQLVWATLVLAGLLVVIGIATGKDAFLIIETAIALAVAAIPEGLPIVATLALARGMWRMARQNALIERLSAVETLGATTVIFTDKTGTLTENRMTVRRYWLPSGEIDLDGDSAVTAGDDPQLVRLLEIAVLCNDATLDDAADAGSGDPMELALLRGADRAGVDRVTLLRNNATTRKHAFDSTSKMMATMHRRDDGFLIAVKGAPEAVLARATSVADEGGEVAIDHATRAIWHERIGDLGRHGLRVLACASKNVASADADPYDRLTLLGLIALDDPARADVPDAIKACQRAGIRVVMVTGDHAVTARSIGRAVGLGGADVDVVEGRDVARLVAGHSRALFDADIFARVSPAEKLDLVRAYQSEGAIVAMTGDGVNDAPALRQADIGVAMGLRGTDVAREAAAMILLDDAFPTIVKAIREGRVIFGNIRRFVAYLLSCNLSEVLVVGLAVLSTLPLPILPLQILYLNLVTDVFPAFALAMGEGGRDVLERPPRHPKEPILGRAQWITIVLQSLGLTAGTFGALALARFGLELDSRSVVTVTFLTLAFAQLWHVFNMRDAHSGVVRNEITRNPWVWASQALCAALLIIPPYLPPLAHVLHLAPPTPAMWGIVLAMSLAPLIVAQIVTAIVRRWRAGLRPAN
ncbi:HAD-IC family P-type ATPase [Rhodopseudomonas sp.]|uniref:cation-translocating P-type ATPase n=1 Tax=Rhodopseudomonas sp. TaxID=1078 RepID=UPI0025F915D9|nr:HAD-IC family P-type ATPase [Rhodopseudomonas sp.]